MRMNQVLLLMLVGWLALPSSVLAFYNPEEGRWLNRDPIGESGGKNLYGFNQNNPERFVDLLGLHLKRFPGGPDVFWYEWTETQRGEWFKDFKDTFGPLITMMAERHCVPKELLATIIANEMIDYNEEEYRSETQEFDWRPRSRGPGQITYDTIFREGIFSEEERRKLQIGRGFIFTIHLPGDPTVHLDPRNGNNSQVERWLTIPQFNIDVAARLLKNYLDKICQSAGDGTMSASFANDVSPGCSIPDFCCRQGKSCKAIVSYNAPKCLIQALSSVWNNGPKLTTVDDIPKRSPNGYNHGRWAGDLDGIFDP